MYLIQKILNYLGKNLEFYLVYASGKLFGISVVVKYLRNPNPQITVKLLRSFGCTIGNKTTFKGSLLLDNVYEDENSAGNFQHLIIGDNCYIGDHVYFDLSNKIILRDNVLISGKVSFVTHADCNRSDYLVKHFPRKCQQIEVGQGSWIGFDATLLAGVNIGVNSVISAKSLVRSDVESQTVYAGIPAKKIKDIENQENKNLHFKK
jgi:acetyltransferase-like isoleucine patch superfamily enzyme